MRSIVLLLAWFHPFHAFLDPGFGFSSTISPARLSRSAPHEAELSVKIPGDLTLGGLFSLHAKRDEWRCGELNEEVGIHRLEAMLYAVDMLNSNTKLLPNITVGVDLRDDCETVNTALEQCLNFLLDSLPNKGSCRSSQEHKSASLLAGVVGPAYSSLAIQVASLLRLFRVPQVSYSATSSELSEKNRFDYFLRTVPPDSYQSQAIVDIIKSMNWSAVFAINSRGSYGEGGMRSFFESAAKSNVCIVYRYQLKPKMTTKDFDNIFIRFKKYLNVHVVVLFCNSEDVRYILSAAKRQNLTKHYTWLASDFWGSKYKHLVGLEDVAIGAITIELKTNRERLKPFYYHFFNLTLNNNKRNPWFKEYWQNHFRCHLGNTSGSRFKTRCHGNETYDSQRHYDSKVSFVIDAVAAFGHALNDLHQSACGGRPGLCDVMRRELRPSLLSYLYNVTFNGTNGTIKFNKHGDTEGKYDILQLTKIGNSLAYQGVGRWIEGHLDIDKDSLICSLTNSQCGIPCKSGYFRRMLHVKCCWSCEPCEKDQYSRNDEYNCSKCPRGQKPNSTFDGCDNLPVRYLEPLWVIIISACSGAGLLATLFIMVVFVKFMKTPLIMAAGRELSAVLFLGVILCYVMAFVRVVKPTDLLCGFRRFGTGFAFCLCYSSLLVKTNRIVRIFTGDKSPSFISPKSQLVITAIILFPQIGISFVELFVVVPKSNLLYKYPDYVMITCAVDTISAVIQLCYNVVLILLCTYYAFYTRKTPLNFNEAKFIGFCMYTTCVIWIAFLPMYYGMGGGYEALAICCSLILSATTILVFIFVPKVYIVLFTPEKNLKSNSRLRSRTMEDGGMDVNYSENNGNAIKDAEIHANHSPSFISRSPASLKSLAIIDLKTLQVSSL